MKKRLLAWLLAVALVVGVLPAVALADTTGEEPAADSGAESSGSVVLNTDGTVKIGETTYNLCLGQGTQREDGSLGYWLDYVDRGFIPGEGDAVNQFNYYLFLMYRNESNKLVEATETEYGRFWNACAVTANVTIGEQTDAVSEIGTADDGYHKYIPVSVTGAQTGTVSAAIGYQNSADTVCTINAPFQFTAATKLTLDADSNFYPISISDAQSDESYFYYIDLGEKQTVTVSGALANDPIGRLVLAQTAEGTDESMLWWRWNGDSSVNQVTRTITTDTILLRVTASDTETITGTVTVSAAQSGDNTQSGSGDQSGGGNQPVVPEAPALPDGVPTVNFYDSQTRDLNDRLTHVYWRNLQEGEGEYRTLWYVTETGFAMDEQAAITVTVDDEAYTPVWVERSSGNFDLKILLHQPERGRMGYIPYNVIVSKDGTEISGIQVDYMLEGVNQVVDGLTISFAQVSESGAVRVDKNVIGGQGNVKSNGNYGYRTNAMLVAAYRNDEGGWTVDQDVTNSLRVEEWKIVNINGDPSTFSWSNNGYVDTLTDVSVSSIPLYVKPGSVAQSMVEAKVIGTINGLEFSTTITGGLYVYFLAGGTYDCSEYDTVEELNAFLQSLAEDVNVDTVQGTMYTIKLADTTYTGTIVLPEEFQGFNTLNLHGATGGDKKTVIQGGIDLNTAWVEHMRDIHFVAGDTSASERTRALYGGGTRRMVSCSFYGYDIAVDASNGLINAFEGNVFVNNEVAVLVDLEDVVPTAMYRNLSTDEWGHNTFINNTTAVQILSLHEKVSAFYFRIYDSNFINNGTDIDARCGGNLYMYRNYFGQYAQVEGIRPTPGKPGDGKHNGWDDLRLDVLLEANTKDEVDTILIYATAKVTVNDTTNVFTNPRWMFPVLGWWGFNIPVNDPFFGQVVTPVNALMTLAAEGETEEDYVNVLVADWDNKTVILNEESTNLLLDASAFETGGEKEIGVLNEDEETLGTWVFDEEEGA